MGETSQMQKSNWLPGCSVLFLLFPLVLFVYGWVREPISIVLLLVLLGFLLSTIRDLYLSFRQAGSEYLISDNRSTLRAEVVKWVVAFLVILVWLLLSGTGGFGYQNMDYWASNALLKDLIEQPWPLTVEWNGTTEPLVYYVGWYLPAALVGKALGWSAANIFSLLWTFLGVFLSFLWFLRCSAIRNLNAVGMLAVLLVFCLADGLDLLMIDDPNWGYFQYSAQTILMYWVPQHTIPAWLATGLVADCIYGRLSTTKYLAVALAACLVSSPFGAIGVLPYLMIVLVMNWRAEQRRAMFSLQSVALNAIAIPFGLIGLLYLSANKYSFPMGFLWEFIDFAPILFIGWFAFCLVEFGVLSIVVFSGLRLDHLIYIKKAKPADRPGFRDFLERIHGIDPALYVLFVTSVIVLFLLPSYKMGYRGDLAMRASIPSLFIFWAFISKILVDSGFNRNPEIRLFYLMTICLTVIGFYLSLRYISQSVAHYHFGPPDREQVATIANANPPWIVEQRIGSTGTFFYQYLAK